MAIAAQLAQLIAEKAPQAAELTDCDDATKDLCLKSYLMSMTKEKRQVFFTEATEVFDPLSLIGDECEMGKQVMAALFITMDGVIGDDVAGELIALRNQERIEQQQSRRARA